MITLDNTCPIVENTAFLTLCRGILGVVLAV